MKEHPVNRSADQLTLVAMATSARVLGRVAAAWESPGLFSSGDLNLLGDLAVRHYRKHLKPPSRDGLGDALVRWAARHPGLVDKAAQAESTYQGLPWGAKVPAAHATEAALEVFRRAREQQFADEHQAALLRGDLDGAEKLRREFKPVELLPSQGISLSDAEAWRAAFPDEGPEVLVSFTHGLRLFFGDLLQRETFFTFVAPEKRGKCVAEDCEVLLADGSVRTVRDLVEDGRPVSVATLNESTQRFEASGPVRFSDNGVKECWAVKTRTGRRVVTTANHRYLTPDGWKRLEDIRPGDYVAVPKRVGFFGDRRVLDAEVEFTAFMLADGGMRGAQPTYTKTDAELASRFATRCGELGIRCHRRGITTHLSGAWPVIDRLDVGRGVLSKRKSIPDWVFRCPRDQVALFLRVFFSGDGYVSRDGSRLSVCVTLASKKMLRQLAHLLSRFGIVWSIRYKPVILDGKKFKAWRLSIRCGESVRLFLSDINFLSYKQTDTPPPGPLKSFLDKFPTQVAQRFYDRLAAEYDNVPVPASLGSGKGKYVRKGHAFRQAFGERKASFIREQLAKGCPIMRQSFAHADPTSPAVREFMGSDVLWDEVVSIKQAGKKRTYDLAVPVHHNFIANDCVVHNSWWLLHVAWNALMQGRRVVYFEAGDMTQAQVFRRLASRAARRPWGPGTARVPIAIKADGYDPEDARVTGTREERFEGFLTAKAGHKAYLDLLKAKVKTKGDPFRLYCFPTGTLAVDQVRQVLRDEKAEGRPADVVVIDYADILAMPTGRMEYRDRIGEVWKQLRGLSMSEHVCLFTATQGNRESYGQKLLLMKHIGEDKRKLSFVNGAVGINVWGREKGQGRCRLNWLCGRDVPASEWQVVHCAGALELANPAIRSVFLRPEECAQRKKDGGD